MNDILIKIAAENRAAEAALPAPTSEQVEQEAKFLRKWSKGKAIIRQSSDSTFWACGRNMTKLNYKMVEGLAAGGHCILRGDPRLANTAIIMKSVSGPSADVVR